MRLMALMLSLLMLSGCSWMKFWESDEDKALAPAELVDFEPEVRIRKQWSTGAGDGQDPLYANLVPAMLGNTIYAADDEGRVYAVDTSNGKVRWKQDLDRQLSGGVGVGGNLVLGGDLRGALYALDASSGNLLWRKKVKGEILSAPSANDNLVVVQTLDSRLLALNPANGETLWQYNTDVPTLTLRGVSSPILTSSVVIAGFANGKIVALEPGNGALLWEKRVALPKGRTELERIVDVDGSPLLVGDVVYATSYQGRAAAMSRGTGRELWFQDISSYQPPAHGLDQVFISTDKDAVTALRANSGQVLWTNDKLRYRRITSPAYAGGYVAVGDLDGYLHLLSPVDGRFVGRIKVDGSGLSAPFLVDGSTLYVQANDGSLVAYRFESR